MGMLTALNRYRYYQVSKESDAIGEVTNSPEIIYKDILEEDNGKNNIY